MAAGRLNLIWVQGTPYRRAFSVKEGTASGPARNLTGWSAVMHVRRYLSDPAPLVALTTATDPTLLSIDGPGGILYLDLPASFIESLRARRGVWGVNLVDPAGAPLPLLGGKWYVRPRAVS